MEQLITWLLEHAEALEEHDKVDATIGNENAPAMPAGALIYCTSIRAIS